MFPKLNKQRNPKKKSGIEGFGENRVGKSRKSKTTTYILTALSEDTLIIDCRLIEKYKGISSVSDGKI